MERMQLLSQRLHWAIERKKRLDPTIKRITSAALAKAGKKSPAAASNWMSDTHGMDAESARGVGAFLDVDPVWLETGNGDPVHEIGSDRYTGPERRVSREDQKTPREEDFMLVPQLDVRAACGTGGKFNDHVVVTGGLAFKRSFLAEMGVNEETGRVINAEGASMEPTISHGRVVLINLSDTAPRDGKVFLICDEDGGMVLKRLVREHDIASHATVWKLRSDNPNKVLYGDRIWPEDARAKIIGRAIWYDGLL